MGHKILLADDSITIQKVIELTFSDEDFELHTVGNGQKAIDEIRSIMPDVVLCDIIMPEKNGYEVCEFIKSSADLKHIPVLLLTGAFEPFDQERAKAAGCEGFLAKPFEPQTLISRVKELLENAAKPAPAAAPAPAAPAPSPTPAPAHTPPAAPASFDSMESDATVLVPPPPAAAAPPSASGPQVTPTPTPPPADASGSGVDDAFAVEAGERELSMGPSDHTVLLGAQDVASGGGPGSSASSNDDDVWGQVTAQSDEDEASTVFMAAPPPIAEAPKPSPPQGASPGSDPDATWQMPSDSPGKSDSAEGSGFQELAEPPSPPEPRPATPPQPQADAFEPVFEAEPEPQPAEASFEPVESQSYQDFEPMSADTQASGFTTDATIDPVVSSDPFESASEPEPEVVSSPPPAPRAPAATSAPPPSTPKAAPAPPAPAASAAAPPPQPATAAPASASSNSDGVDEALVEKIAQRVVDKLSSKVIQEIAWEVVPDLAEGLIVKEIEALKAKIPK